MEAANESTYNRPEVEVAVDSPRRDFHRSSAYYVQRYGICTQRRSLLSIRDLSGTTIPTSAQLLLYRRESKLSVMRLRSMRLCAMWLRAMWVRPMRRLRSAATCGGRTTDREARIYRAPVCGGLLSGAGLWLSATTPPCSPVYVPVVSVWVRTAKSVPLGIRRRAGAATRRILSLAMVSGHYRYRAALLRMPAVFAKCPPPLMGGGTGGPSWYSGDRCLSPANVGNSVRLITS